MARYSIDGQILTDIADSIREKVGKADGVPTLVEAIYEFSHTANSLVFNGIPQGTVMLKVDIPNVDKVLIRDIVVSCDATNELYMRVGNNPQGNNYVYTGTEEYVYGDPATPTEFEITKEYSYSMYIGIRHNTALGSIPITITATVIGLDANGNVLVNKEVMLPYLITPEQMADEISDMAIVPDEAFVISGDCTYRFGYSGWNWFIEDYGSKITTNNITNGSYMFYLNSGIQRIPFELNFGNTEQSIASMFYYCDNLLEIPKMSNIHPNNISSLFKNCFRLRHIPEDIDTYFVWDKVLASTSAYSYSSSALFGDCYSLRNIPEHFLGYCNPVGAYSITYLYQGFENCYALDELVGLPLNYTATYTSGIFYKTFNYCSRLKNLTFAMPDGQPYVMKWKSQVIDLSSYIGWAYAVSHITNYNSGITEDKWVYDDATYQALKNDPDWFTAKVEYSRYNHDSAVATINSLPDTSAYLATAGGTNTIKFKGAAGSATDGGAINTLTEEEIAVATAKGWTVTLV